MHSVSLAEGNVMLSAPRGYCIDPATVRRAPNGDFALIARCDMLGASGFFASRGVALISVVVGRQQTATQPSLEDLTKLVPEDEVLERRPNSDPPMVRLHSTSGTGIDGTSPQHWRGAFSVNGHMVALALYAPDNSPALSPQGARLLSELTRRTRASSHRPNLPIPSQEPTSKPAQSGQTRPEPRPQTKPDTTGGPVALLGKVAALFD